MRACHVWALFAVVGVIVFAEPAFSAGVSVATPVKGLPPPHALERPSPFLPSPPTPGTSGGGSGGSGGTGTGGGSGSTGTGGGSGGAGTGGGADSGGGTSSGNATGGATLASLTTGGGGSSAGNSSSGTASGISTASVTQSIDDATQRAVGARGQADDDCADSRGREQSESQNDKKCQRPARRRQQAQGSITKAPVPPPPPPPVTYSGWAYGFGDYEVHQNVAPNSGADVTRRTATGGALGGFDLTFQRLGAGADSLMLGFMAGYSASKLTFPGDVLNTRTQISGTSVGGYVKYFTGPFWNETIFRTDLFGLNQDQSFVGSEVSGSTRMNVYTIADNFNYRFNAGAGWWEPTIGVQYSSTQYGGNAVALSLANGFDWRVQGGLRTGITFPWNNFIVSTTVTGLAYSDVQISGFVVDNGLAPTSLPEDAGKVRGEGIVTANLDLKNGTSIFAQGDVRGGKDLLAAGGRLGMRIGW
jgi:hypothetical protein